MIHTLPARLGWLAVTVLLVLAALAAACGGGNDGDDGGASGVDITDDPRLETFDDELTAPGQQHLATGQAFAYPTTPPYGGPHGNIPARCGVYQEQQRFEPTTHTMEHGAVIVWYDPDAIPAEDVATLRELGLELLEDGRRLIVSPSTELSDPVVLASWGHLLRLDQYEPETIRAFTDEFENEAPERLPRGNAC